MLVDSFKKEEIMKNVNLEINPYLESFSNIFEALQRQIEIIENLDKSIKLFLKFVEKIL